MKILTLCLLLVALIGCTVPTASAVTVEEYRQGMANGAIASTAVVSKVLCGTLKTSSAECDELSRLMMNFSLISVASVPDSQITTLIAKDPAYKSAMKEGAIIFSTSVGGSLCNSLKLTYPRCASLQENIRNASNEFIDSLSPEAIDKLRQLDSRMEKFEV